MLDASAAVYNQDVPFLVLNQNGMTQFAFQRLDAYATEIEFWTKRELLMYLKTVIGCKVTDEAGVNQFESVFSPRPTVEELFKAVTEVFSMIGKNNFYFTVERPAEFALNANRWNDKKRYDDLRAALEKEAPGYGHMVNEMTNFSSSQGNFSGPEMKLRSDFMAFLVSLINWLAPGLAADSHKKLGYGKGHLSIWRNFADKRRFPTSGLWYGCFEEMMASVESLRKLFKVTDEGSSEVYPNELQSFDDPLDLTFNWRHGRPKVSDLGPYFETRFEPTGPIEFMKRATQRSADIIEVAWDWFEGQNSSQAVPTREAAKPAFEFVVKKLSKHHDIYVPKSKKEWLDLTMNH